MPNSYEFPAYGNWNTAGTRVALFPDNNIPVDRRFVVDTYNNISTTILGKTRYPGLKVYVIDTAKEYWFKGGVSASDNLVQYHPDPYIVSDLSNANPLVCKEVTVVDEGVGAARKYIRNSKDDKWIELAGSGEGGSSRASLLILPLSHSEDNITSINNITSANISTAYAAKTKLNPLPGTVVCVLFTDDSDQANQQEFCREYVYINGEWKITRGTQEYRLTLSYDGSYTITPNNGDANNPNPKVTINNQGEATVIITHQFDAQFIDSFVFQEKEEALIDDDDVLDQNGEYVLSGANCFRSGSVNKIRFTFVIPSSGTDTYIITLQK